MRFYLTVYVLFVCMRSLVKTMCLRQDGRTALIWAAEKGRTDIVRLLLESGSDKEAKQNVRRMGFFVFKQLHVSVLNIKMVSARISL